MINNDDDNRGAPHGWWIVPILIISVAFWGWVILATVYAAGCAR